MIILQPNLVFVLDFTAQATASSGLVFYFDHIYLRQSENYDFGDAASGKSTFASQLGEKLHIPVVYLDDVMAKTGRVDKTEILRIIKKEIDKPTWIIKGNASTRDQTARIQAADTVIVFDSNRFVSLKRHIFRSLRIKVGVEQQKGGVTGTLN